MQNISQRQEVPKVSTVTALDWYMTVCYGFCFAALVQYAIVNYFTVIGPKQIIENVRKNPNYSKLAMANNNNVPWWQRPLHSLHRLRAAGGGRRKNRISKQQGFISTPVSDMHEIVSKYNNKQAV